jgi:subtilisin-like proprotein convertase family protein
MRRRFLFWLSVTALCLIAALYSGLKSSSSSSSSSVPSTRSLQSTPAGQASKQAAAPQSGANAAASATNATNRTNAPKDRFAYRLRNTDAPLRQLERNDHAILLANALIDTAQPMGLKIPASLKAPPDNGTYVVQASGPVDQAFRSRLAQAGATIVSYIPNNAYLVRVSETGAQQLAGAPGTQAVLPYEPYYKLDSALIPMATAEKPLTVDTFKLTVFPDAAQSATATLKGMGYTVVSQDRSPFGPVLTVTLPSYGVPPSGGQGVQSPTASVLSDLARLPIVQRIEPARGKVQANDLSRTSLSVSADSVVTTNYLGLTGTNVLVTMADGGVDGSHPDLMGRVFGLNGFDGSGHGTHVAGTIAGSGLESSTVTDAIGSSTNLIGSSSNTMFRGMAPEATLYSLDLALPDADLQEAAALTNSPISNNSWNYGNAEYDIAAASYDAAVRDAVPEKPGPQPVLFVFSAGNAGNGDEGGTSGDSESILSPGTAKNVITVGAIEQFRNITNDLVMTDGTTNQPFALSTDSSNQVASFSSRGNVGIGIEGDFGRFKPDVVAPGVFVISDRSPSWNTNAYFNPTNYSFNVRTNQGVGTNQLQPYSLFVPDNAVSVTITVLTNFSSPVPMPNMPIYVRYADNPTFSVFDILATNTVSIPPVAPLGPLLGSTIFYSIGDGTNISVTFDVETVVATTNDDPSLALLDQLDESLGTQPEYYRYESGTSMAAAGVSGMLALIEDFFRNQLQITNPSPALLKALLINGARSLGSPYDNQVQSQINYQGWGLPALPNSIPAALTNLTTGADPNILPLRFFDQSQTNALATGQQQTTNLSINAIGQGLPLRITLAWTDPPGNPAAGLKLVNDLDLIVTNLDTGDVFYGNDIPSGGTFNEAADTNALVQPNDMINNVENVFLAPPLGTNYSVTVSAHRVNVNAVTANTNNVVQDFALVISSGDGGLFTNVFSLTNTPGATQVSSTNAIALTTITNGLPLFNQRVGANAQYFGTNGIASQWNFYVFTNTGSNATFTNVAFVTFLPPEIGVPRIGTQQADNPPNATREEGDLDLYVSADPNLTNLVPSVVAAADKSVGRTGTEKIIYTNSAPGQVYYVGVKSEDQEGVEYDLVGVATDHPFNQRDGNGNVVLTVLTPPLPVAIPDGSPALPGHVEILALTTLPDRIRKVVVQDSITHQNFGDLIGTLTHGQKAAVLNNHSFFDNGQTSEAFTYDDSGENDTQFPISRHTDGPGNLRNFVGDPAVSGIWILSMVDDSLTKTGFVNSPLTITIEPQPPTNGVVRTIAGNSFFFDFIDVPADATNLTISVQIISANPTPVDLLVRRGDFPSLSVFDQQAILNPPGGSLSITKFDSPPLNAGRYFFAVYNPSPNPVTVRIFTALGLDLNPQPPFQFLSIGNEPLKDDAVTYSTNYVGADSRVVSAQVGVRIDHPRISDLVLTLISPRGTRVLLAENRGGLSPDGYGSGFNITNSFPATTSGSAAAETNIVNTLTNQGTLIINYNFFTIPDTMHVYYDGVRIFDSGLINGAGSFTVDYGPGAATDVVIIMNEGGNPTATEWQYTVTGIEREITYATFSEDTNFATIPIKFATPPFGVLSTNTAPVTVLTSSFETVTPASYPAPAVLEGWTVVDSNAVTVVSVPALASTGTNVLALHHGSIVQILPTVAGRSYTLSFASHGRPAFLPTSWWKGESNAPGADTIDGNNGALQNGVTSVPGLVGNALSFSAASNQFVEIPDAPNLNPSNSSFAIEGWLNVTQQTGTSEGILGKWGDDISPANNYRQWTFEVTAAMGLEFGMSDVANQNNGPFQVINSPANAIPLNTWTHVAAVYNHAAGFRSLYINGTLVAGRFDFPPVTVATGVVHVGLGSEVNQPGHPVILFDGLLDEISWYEESLTPIQIQDVYAAGSAGKCPPTGGNCLINAHAIIGGLTNDFNASDTWQTNVYNFTAPTNGMTLQILADEDGLLVDSFQLTENPGASPNDYFLPEESLDKLIGEPTKGNWQLEVLDNRAGPLATNTPDLVSWQLTLDVETVVPVAIPLTHAVPNSNTVDAFSIVYYKVAVPPWTTSATNLLYNVNGNPLNLLFNQNTEPTVANNVFLFAVTPPSPDGNNFVLNTTGSTPPLLPGETYYLGVQNLGPNPATFTIEVDFNIITLTNGIPYTNSLADLGQPTYYQYDVSTNAIAAAFEILNPSGNVDLVARRGPPLPDLLSFDYISSNPGTNNEAILVTTNSTPVPLTAGRWYLGVFNNDTNTVNYVIRATEIGPPTIIPLTNGIPFTNMATPGILPTNLYSFVINQTNSAALFELYKLSGNVDLTLDRGVLPLTPPFFATSSNPGTNSEQIVIRTNILGTNINDTWFLGVPNPTTSNVAYTIRAVVATNGILQSGIPIYLTETPPPPGSTNGPTLTWPSVLGETYEVIYTNNLFVPSSNWNVLTTISNAPAPITTFTVPIPIPSFPFMFYRIVQVPTP